MSCGFSTCFSLISPSTHLSLSLFKQSFTVPRSLIISPILFSYNGLLVICFRLHDASSLVHQHCSLLSFPTTLHKPLLMPLTWINTPHLLLLRWLYFLSKISATLTSSLFVQPSHTHSLRWFHTTHATKHWVKAINGKSSLQKKKKIKDFIIYFYFNLVHLTVFVFLHFPDYILKYMSSLWPRLSSSICSPTQAAAL